MPTLSYPNDRDTLGAIIGGLSGALSEALKYVAEAKGETGIEDLRERCIRTVKGLTSDGIAIESENDGTAHALALINAIFDAAAAE